MRIVLCISILACVSVLYAHDSPEDRVRQLTFEMARNGSSPALLMQRGVEYSALGDSTNAALDFEQVVKLDTRAADAFKALAQMRLDQGSFAAALQAIDRAIKLHSNSGEFFTTRARIHSAEGNDWEALADLDRAFAFGNPDLEWFLRRAEIQNHLGLFQECIAGLRKGVRETGSAVLEVELIESLIDGGLCREALQRIEPELKEARLKSSWLLRRARARMALGKPARKDLAAALKELNTRFSDRAPDISLLAERGMAFALIGDKPAAERDLKRAKELGAELALLWRLERALQLPSSVKQ